MLKVKKRLFFSTYHFFASNDYLGALKASQFRPKAVFIGQKGNYKFFREHLTHGKYFCCLESSYLATAEKQFGIGDSFVIRYRSVSYALKPGETFQSKLKLNYKLYQGDDLVGVISENPTRFFIDVEINDILPYEIQCFVFWLSFRAWVGEKGWMSVPKYSRVGGPSPF